MQKKLIIAVGVFVLACVVVLLWPTSRYDIERVHPRLHELTGPYQSVNTDFYLDGGSIGITIIDRDARKLELALPVSAGPGVKYPRLFLGATHMNETGAVEVAFSEDTRRMLVAVIEQHRPRTAGNDIALVGLRGAPRDYAHVLGRAVANFFEGSRKRD